MQVWSSLTSKNFLFLFHIIYLLSKYTEDAVSVIKRPNIFGDNNVCHMAITHTHTHTHTHCCFCLVAWSCPTLWDPIDCSLPDSSVRGIFQARILEWVAISFSTVSSWPRDQTYIFCIARRAFYCWLTRKSPHVHIFIYMDVYILPDGISGKTHLPMQET